MRKIETAAYLTNSDIKKQFETYVSCKNDINKETRMPNRAKFIKNEWRCCYHRKCEFRNEHKNTCNCTIICQAIIPKNKDNLYKAA